MIASRVMVNDGKTTKVTYHKHTLLSYNKKFLLKHLCMYSRWHYRKFPDKTARSVLLRARYDYGTQFLIDLFIISEVYMSHFPTYMMPLLREDIHFVLNTIPNYRLLYEEN